VLRDGLVRRRKRRGHEVDRVELSGKIAGVGFASGDRFVVGVWESSPLGYMLDVMWGRPEGTRVLLAPSEPVASFVSSIYDFDLVEVVRISIQDDTDGFQLTAGPLSLSITAGKPHWIFSLRPSFLRGSLLWSRVEDVLLRGLVGHFVLKGAEGVRAYGRTRTGIRQWYRIHGYRPIVSASASLEGRDLGSLRPLRPALGVGFSEFPQQPAVVRCAPMLEGQGLSSDLAPFQRARQEML
jgi:hypothetical protein